MSAWRHRTVGEQMLRARGQTRGEFLIGEEPFEGDVGFFAPSAMADPPATAETVEATLGAPTGFLPSGGASERGSAMSRGRVRTRYLAGGMLLGPCAVLAAIVALSAPKAHDATSRAAQGKDGALRVGRESVTSDRRSSVTRAHDRRRGVAASARDSDARRTPRRSSVLDRQDPPQAVPQPPQPPTVWPSGESTHVAGGAGPRGEFQFER